MMNNPHEMIVFCIIQSHIFIFSHIDRVRAEIAAMRQEYQFLLKKNKSLVKSQQLNDEEFQSIAMDPALKQEVKKYVIDIMSSDENMCVSFI